MPKARRNTIRAIGVIRGCDQKFVFIGVHSWLLGDLKFGFPLQFLLRFPSAGTPSALIRLAREGSVAIVTFAVMPGFKSPMVALCPLTLISVNCVTVNVLVVFSSLTVIVFPPTLEMTGVWYTGAGVGLFFLPLPEAGAITVTARRTETITNSLFFIVPV